MGEGPAAGGRRRLPRLHAVTDDSVLARHDWVDAAERVLEEGGEDVAVHLRGGTTAGRKLFDLATALAPHARRAGGALIVNDRVDVALVTPVQGVHLGGGSLPVRHVRPLLRAEVWLGCSVHDVGGAAAAGREGADYAFLGTIFPTPSHPDASCHGTDGLSAVAERVGDLPLIGIGGIGPGEAASVVAAGAYGVAAIRGVWDAPDPAAAVKRYLEGFNEEKTR